MNSALYEGTVRHHRLLPRKHAFSYQVAMVYLDLDELTEVFAQHWAWSLERFNLATFRREDYHGDPAIPLKDAVLNTVEKATGTRPDGPVRMLSNLRYFGFIINPITCYYCFSANDKLQYIVSEVTNTPWRERYAYVLGARPDGSGVSLSFDKKMHVSPFMPMDMQYLFSTPVPGPKLNLYMENRQLDKRQFTASLLMQERAVSRRNMSRMLWRYPLMTMKVALGIYWQALRLWIKGIRFQAHPKKKTRTLIQSQHDSRNSSES